MDHILLHCQNAELEEGSRFRGFIRHILIDPQSFLKALCRFIFLSRLGMDHAQAVQDSGLAGPIAILHKERQSLAKFSSGSRIVSLLQIEAGEVK
ncbi:MAG: hypothetical protein A4E49_02695 [Methanosaeta sp. PtaU1.Bin112]|nr:MAG: hypothetical protein A4E49_02695 [Methanosaeta sp. PtaU1.Bin112]